MKANSRGIILGYYQGTFPENDGKKTRPQENPCPGQDSKSGPSELNSEAPG